MADLSLRAVGDEVDFDTRIVGQTGNAYAGPGRQAVGRKKAAICLIEGRVVGGKMGQIRPHSQHVLETEAKAVQYRCQMGHDVIGLGVDTFRQNPWRVRRIRHLAGYEDEPSDFYSM